jgi:hypothetical protein
MRRDRLAPLALRQSVGKVLTLIDTGSGAEEEIFTGRLPRSGVVAFLSITIRAPI